jgi:hypothetical protein
MSSPSGLPRDTLCGRDIDRSITTKKWIILTVTRNHAEDLMCDRRDLHPEVLHMTLSPSSRPPRDDWGGRDRYKDSTSSSPSPSTKP